MINDALIDMYLGRFANRLDVYDKQHLVYDYKVQEMKCIYMPVWEPVTREVLQLHLDYEITIGWPTPTVDGYSKWLCFDSDTADGQLDKLQSFLEQHGWHVIREGKRPGRDGHLWLLFDKPVPASQLRILAQVMMSLASVTIGEIFPKQDKAPKIGNPVRGPLGRHQRPNANNCCGWFEGVEQDVTAQLQWLAQQPLNSADTAIQLAHAHRPTPKPRIIRHNYSAGGNDKIDFIQYAIDNGFKLHGGQYVGPCPACKREGRDQHGDNLSINASSGLVNCWRCGDFMSVLSAINSSAA